MFNNTFYNRLKQKYEEAENEKVYVSDIRQAVQDEFKNVTKEETGRIIKYAFPKSQRKRHHSGTNYFYKGIKKKWDYADNQCIDAPHREDGQREKCHENNPSSNTLENLTTQLRSKLDHEKQKILQCKLS